MSSVDLTLEVELEPVVLEQQEDKKINLLKVKTTFLSQKVKALEIPSDQTLEVLIKAQNSKAHSKANLDQA